MAEWLARRTQDLEVAGSTPDLPVKWVPSYSLQIYWSAGASKTLLGGDTVTKSVSSRDCSYGVVGESDHYHNDGRVNFGNNIKGIANPWKCRFGRLHAMSETALGTIESVLPYYDERSTCIHYTQSHDPDTELIRLSTKSIMPGTRRISC
ncbi:hypothetical protein ElyMa_004260800 [Elysia marginata]|uniref:Peptidase M12A domain-containing protein n=1 Tax=Elysia marginata TaxID=1093978 RepID=A0AAV4GSI7_9GAST|nr:hypothetical protein ElyMa_004260800 [Elysia marginata]